MRSVIFISQAGCFLPLLFLFNLIFGWMFLPPLVWLCSEGIIFLLIILNFFILSRKITNFAKKNSNVIDVQGEVIDDRTRLK